MDAEILAHYSQGIERDRLAGAGGLELARTQEVLRRYLPAAPAVVYDVGGGPGAHARWLVEAGYTVRLLDAVPLHVEQARAAGLDAQVGDACSLPYADASADAVLLLGPLYHLTRGTDRARAIAEAARVVRSGGLVVAAAVNRFASLLDGFVSAHHDDPAFAPIVARDLASGQHRNPSNRDGWFTTAFFHHPDELHAELRAGGLEVETVVGVEGPAWLFGRAWTDRPDRRAIALDAARAIETEPSLLGLSAHLLGVARRR